MTAKLTLTINLGISFVQMLYLLIDDCMAFFWEVHSIESRAHKLWKCFLFFACV